MTQKENRRTALVVCLVFAGAILLVGCEKKKPTPPQKPPEKTSVKPAAKPAAKPAPQKPAPQTIATELEGAWVGQELNGPPGDWTLKVSGKHLDATGPDQSHKITLLVSSDTDPKRADLVIQESSDPDSAGKIALGIYKIEANKLTLAVGSPDSKERPSSFEPGDSTRVWVLTKK